MAVLEVIHDPAKELAAIVNVDDQVGWGPAMIGPNAGEILQAFLDATPFDLSETDSFTARRHFESFLVGIGAIAPPATEPSGQPPAQPTGDAPVDVGTAPDAAAGAPTDEPPPPAPADADMEADQGAADQIAQPSGGADATPPAPDQTAGGTPPATPPADQGAAPVQAPAEPQPPRACPNCQGTGRVQHDPAQPATECPFCGGAGQIAATVPS